ncbi:MAG: hypothetical protein JWP01_1048 [Myxococcales bacterium]|nr:hypothetical protein [Myxococcales bacterium]
MQPRLASQRSLVVAPPPPALATQSTHGLTYIRGAVASPVCVAIAVFGACLGLGYAGIIGALVAMLAVIGLGAMSARYGFVQRHLDHQAHLRARAKRENGRLRSLRPAGPVRQTQYLELRDLVEEVERTDPSEAQRFELQDLLDHFVRLAVSHQRCIDALRLAGGNELPVAIPITDANKSKRRREIQARRIRHRDECLRRIERLTDEIEAVDELVRLVAQRTACPSLDTELDREIERRLWELDEVDAALDQLSA